MTGGSDKSDKKELVVLCPCCEGRLTVDAETGAILRAEARRGVHNDFDEALGAVEAGAERREDDFLRAFASEKKRSDLLERKFAKAKEQAEQEPRSPDED